MTRSGQGDAVVDSNPDQRDAGWGAPRLSGAALSGGGGIIWGLGLARLLAEAALWSLFYTSPLAVAALALTAAAGSLVLWRWSWSRREPPSQPRWLTFVPFFLPLPYVVGLVSHPLAGAVFLAGGVALTLLLTWRGRPRWALPALLALVALSLYLRTLLPSIGEADTLEFQVVVPQLGVAHPTGYPLYVLLGKLFTLLPMRQVAWRVNLASAVFGVGAVVVLYAIIRRLTGPAWTSIGPPDPAPRETQRGRWTSISSLHGSRGQLLRFPESPSAEEAGPRLRLELIPFLTALAFAFSATFWSQAIIAEVYTLHNLMVGGILWLLLRQVEPVQRRDTAWVRRWYAVSFLLGLSLTNHLTTVLLVPAALVAWLISSRPLGSPRGSGGTGYAVGEGRRDHDGGPLGGPAGLGLREGLIAAALFALGLSIYVFIPLRWPSLHDGARMTLLDFLLYITGGQFHGALRLDGWRDPTRWRIVGRLLHQPFGWAGLALAVVGILHLAARRRRVLALTGVTFLAFFIYGLDYYVADVAVFLLPAQLILAIWIGVGAAAMAEYLSGESDAQPDTKLSFNAQVGRTVLVVLFAFLPLRCIWTNLPAVDRSGDRGAYDWGRYAMRQPLAEGSAVLADTKKFAPLYYLQQVEGVRPDLDIVLLGTEELYQAELRRRLGEGQTVYLARYLPNLDGLYLRSVGPLAEVAATPSGEEESAQTSEAPRLTLPSGGQGTVRLLDAEVEEDPFGRGLYHVTLHWQAETSLVGDFVVRLRLMDSDGRQRWVSDGARPVGGLYPTNAWPPSVPISDYHQMTIPAWLPPATYELQVGLFSPFEGQGLRPDGGSTPWVGLRGLDLPPSLEPEPLPYRRLFKVGDAAWLTGADFPREGAAGAPLTVDIAWRKVAEAARVELWWADAEGNAIQGHGEEPVLDGLEQGMMRSRHVITAPGEIGRHTLHVGLAGEPARCGWLAGPMRGCPLAVVHSLAGAEGLANFGDRVLLLEADVGRKAAQPGQLVPVALRWRGIRDMAVDYTVFVHLVGPDGRLHGQVDSWPVQGSYPTTQWRPGRDVLDHYEVRLEPDAPPGSYQVQVGLYDLETMERLPLLNAAGEPLGDSFLVGTVDVSQVGALYLGQCGAHRCPPTLSGLSISERRAGSVISSYALTSLPDQPHSGDVRPRGRRAMPPRAATAVSFSGRLDDCAGSVRSCNATRTASPTVSLVPPTASAHSDRSPSPAAGRAPASQNAAP